MLTAVFLLRWLLAELIPIEGSRIAPGRLFLAGELARLIIGLAVWLPFWRYAQGLFYGPVERERESLVRKSYLYLVIFGTVMAVVTTATIVLSDLLKRLMDVPAGGGDLREAISIIIVAGVIWAYHAFVLRGDTIRQDLVAGLAAKRQNADCRFVAGRFNA